MLEIKDLKVDIKNLQILRGIKLGASQGQITALVGRNGAGKTTTMRAVMGLLKIKSGIILLDKNDLIGTPVHDRVSLGVGFMPEDRRIIPSISVEENLLLPTWNTQFNDTDKRLSKIYELIPEVKKLSRRKGCYLSGGEQKLTALGRAMMAGRKLILLDEPFEGVAPKLVGRIQEIINIFQENLSIIISTSEYRDIPKQVSTVYFIDRGVIVNTLKN